MVANFALLLLFLIALVTSTPTSACVYTSHTTQLIAPTIRPLARGDEAVSLSQYCDRNTKRCVPDSFPIVAPRYWMCYGVEGTDHCLQISNPSLNQSLLCSPTYSTNSSFACALQYAPSNVSSTWFACADCSLTQTGEATCWTDQVPRANDLVPPSCPTFKGTLIMFAVVNIVVSFLGLIIGFQPVTNLLTCGACGRENSSPLWVVTWLLPVGLQLVASATIGAVIRARPGYGYLNISQLMLLFTARPRLSWFFLSFAGIFNKGFEGSTKSSFIAEFILQGFATYPMVSVLNYAQTQLGGLTINYSVNPQAAYIMTSGAFLFMFWVFLGIFFAVIVALVVFTVDLDSRKEDMSLIRWLSPMATVCVLPTMYLGSWLFWVGFIKISLNEYCPPDIWSQGVIFGVYSILGIFLGTAF